jgi:glycosyltransferase involved in cell wall biosynthesis
MRIGIDASRAFLENRTGIEEYSHQVIKNLRNFLKEEKIFLYVRKNQVVDFELPSNWEVRIINYARFWTQFGLSLEMFLRPVDVLFVPAHTVPIIHPKKTIVTIHGLEYEFCPEAYSFFERIYMRLTIKKSCQWASEIISVSENTKKDLINLYHVSEEKIKVVYEGYDRETRNFKLISNDKISKSNTKYKILDTKYILFVGRIEERKNIINIIKAFEILKEKYKISHKLVLAGKPGFGFQKIQRKIQDTKYIDQIILTGFVADEEKWELLKKTDAFVFPTQYEGFGIPVLEAQSVGCPVVASNNSSIPEVAGKGAFLVDPLSPEDIAERIFEIISNKELKDDIIQKGLKNTERFGWEKCAKEIAKSLL